MLRQYSDAYDAVSRYLDKAQKVGKAWSFVGDIAKTIRGFQEPKRQHTTSFIHIPSVLNRYTYPRGVPRSARAAIRYRRNFRRNFYRRYRRY